ncbi:MAG: excinuclease ABC subunit UvrC [Dethiobacteria bacterium]
MTEEIRKKLKEEKVDRLPRSPGVYLFHNREGKVIYVGKAIDLRQRVRSYFQNLASLSPRVRIMAEKIADLSYIITDSEVEAFILESNLIKEYTPHYNVQFKDDKRYPYLCLTTNEPFPRLVVARQPEKKKAKYFGPYSNVGAVRDTMRLIKKLFPLRSCKQPLQEGTARGRPCLNWQIKRCLAPCRGSVSGKEYLAVVEQVILFLEGRQQVLLKKIEHEMGAAAEALDYEKAARLRDQLFSLQKLMERQKVVTSDMRDRDIIALVSRPWGFSAGLFKVRGGKLLGAENFSSRRTQDMEPEVVTKEFIRHFYSGASFIPGELLLSHLPEEHKFLEKWLEKEKGGGRVTIRVPQRGEKKALLELLKRNTLQHSKLEEKGVREDERVLEELAKVLGLPTPPERIEGYDISHFGGKETVGSMVVFQKGRPWKEGYRRFKIRKGKAADDYGALAEMLERRLHNSKLPPPSLVLIDGGRGQLSIGQQIFRAGGLGSIPMVALAEEEELLFVPNRKNPLRLSASHPALKLLQRVRDEAHRFALSLSQDLNVKSSIGSFLESVPGIGPIRRKALLEHFKGLEAIREATLEEIRSVKGINARVAGELYRKLHGIT